MKRLTPRERSEVSNCCHLSSSSLELISGSGCHFRISIMAKEKLGSFFLTWRLSVIRSSHSAQMPTPEAASAWRGDERQRMRQWHTNNRRLSCACLSVISQLWETGFSPGLFACYRCCFNAAASSKELLCYVTAAGELNRVSYIIKSTSPGLLGGWSARVRIQGEHKYHFKWGKQIKPTLSP